MRPAIERIGPVALWIVLLLCLAPYVALIGAAHWGTDEYFVAAVDHHDGLRGLLDRLAGWSPRPFAETLMAVYFRLVEATRRPLVVPLLALGWAASVAAIALAARRAGQRRPLLLAVSLLVALLLFGPPEELMYWPMATAAYLTAWAALGAALLLALARPPAPWPLAGALLVAALSAETGALIAVLVAASMLARALLHGRWRAAAFWLAAALPGAAVCWSVGRHRMRMMAEIMDPGSHLAGHWPASLVAALPPFLHALAGLEGVALLPALLLKLAVLAALPRDEPAAGARRFARLLWIAFPLLAAYATIALALHQFGLLCCVRHTALRQGLVLLAGLSAGPLLAARLPRPWRPPLLGAALLGLLAIRLPALRDDLALLPQHLAAQRATWKSGEAPGRAMRYWLTPQGPISGGASWAPQLICLREGGGVIYGPESIAGFFGKQSLSMRPWAARAAPVPEDCPRR